MKAKRKSIASRPICKVYATCNRLKFSRASNAPASCLTLSLSWSWDLADKIIITGREEALYGWFDKLNVPEDFRMATHINLSPNKQDDTQIDCTATIEQWFVPPA